MIVSYSSYLTHQIGLLIVCRSSTKGGLSWCCTGKLSLLSGILSCSITLKVGPLVVSKACNLLLFVYKCLKPKTHRDASTQPHYKSLLYSAVIHGGDIGLNFVL